MCTAEGVHTLTCCSLSAHIRTSSHVCHTHAWLKCHEKGVCTRVTSLHLVYSLLMIHPSLLFLDGHFETTPDDDFTDDPVHTFLPYLPVLKAQDMRHSTHASRSLATCPDQMQTQGLAKGYLPRKAKGCPSHHAEDHLPLSCGRSHLSQISMDYFVVFVLSSSTFLSFSEWMKAKLFLCFIELFCGRGIPKD